MNIMFDIIAYLIIAGAAGVTLWKIFSKKRPNKSDCTGCSSSCGDCELMSLKNKIKAQQEQNSNQDKA